MSWPQPRGQLRPPPLSSACVLIEVGPSVVAVAQVVLEEDVQHDEEVAAAHLLEGELGGPCGPAPPSDRNDSVAVPPDHCLQRQLDSEVEVVREQGSGRLDHSPPVGLEGVGGVVVSVAKQEADAPVDDPVQDQLEPRIR